MSANIDNLHNQINANDALKEELEDLKNKVLMNLLTEEEQLVYLEAYMIPYAKKLGINFTIEEIKEYIKKENDFDEIPKDTEATSIQMMTAGDIMHHFFDDDKKDKNNYK